MKASPSFIARAQNAIAGMLLGKEKAKFLNLLGPGLGLPSGNPAQGRSMGTPSQTRDILPRERREAVATHRILRDRVPFVRALINGITDLALGDQGMQPTFKSGDPDYDARALAYCKAAWRRQTWDITGQDNGASMQRLVLRSMITDGEIFGIQVLSNFGTTQRQLVVTEQIGGSYLNESPGIIDGIEYNAVGRPIRYFVNELETTPYQALPSKARPVEARNILHVYDRERATQKRGLPWGYTGLNHGIDSLDTAELIKVTMKLNSAIVATHTTQSGEVAASINAFTAAAQAASAAGTAAATSDVNRDTGAATRMLDVHGTMIPVFKAGDGMTFLQGRAAANEIEFLGWLAAQYALGIGLPIDVVTGIATGSAATHANSDIVQRFLKGVQRLMIDDWNQPSTENLLANGITAYYFLRNDPRNMPDKLKGVPPLEPPREGAQWNEITWRGPRAYQVNKTRDANSNIKLIQAGLMSDDELFILDGSEPDEKRREIDANTARRYKSWVEQGLPEERFWQREFGPTVQFPPTEQPTPDNA